jgi:hypothetical protein
VLSQVVLCAAHSVAGPRASLATASSQQQSPQLPPLTLTVTRTHTPLHLLRACAVLSPVMEARNARLTYGSTVVDASRMVIIVISDVGLPELQRFMVEAAKEGADGRLLGAFLEKRLRAQLSLEWRNAFGGLDMGARATAIVPFLPLNYTGSAEVIRHYLRRLSDDPAFQRYWDQLRFTEEVVTLLAEPKYVDYNATTCALPAPTATPSAAKSATAKGAASGSASVKVGADGSQLASAGAASAAASRAASGYARTLCGTAVGLPGCAYVNHGARRLVEQHNSPLKRLGRALLRAVKPAGRAATASPGSSASAVGPVVVESARWHHAQAIAHRSVLGSVKNATSRLLGALGWGSGSSKGADETGGRAVKGEGPQFRRVTIALDLACAAEVGGAGASRMSAVDRASLRITRCVAMGTSPTTGGGHTDAHGHGSWDSGITDDDDSDCVVLYEGPL